jgi:DNA-directed RNA polymerase specialized sigma24 family protein
MVSMRWHAANDAMLLHATPGDRRAFGVFYERHEHAVLGFLGAVTRQPDLAADLAAETFAAALQAAASYDPARGSARAWLFGIARHVLAASARRGQVESEARRRLGLDASRGLGRLRRRMTEEAA